jgi:cell division transport system permease protein
MRLNYILSDLGIGLKRNLSMTIAVVVTIWVSLSLFGSALLAREQVDLMKGNWYDKIQISVFLCTKDSGGRGCSGAEVTTEQKNRIKQVIESSPTPPPRASSVRARKRRTTSSRNCTRTRRSSARSRWTRCRSPSGSS